MKTNSPEEGSLTETSTNKSLENHSWRILTGLFLLTVNKKNHENETSF